MDRTEFIALVKGFEKSLFKAKSQIDSLESAPPNFAEAAQALKKIERAISETPSLASDFQARASETKSVSAWKHSVAVLSELSKQFAELSEESRPLTAFVEAFRGRRVYKFDSPGATISFFSELTDMFSVRELKLRPQFIGTIDLGAISSELGLGVVGKELSVAEKDSKKVLKFLCSNKKMNNLVFTAPNLKIYWENPLRLMVDTDSNRLKRIDRLCNAFSGVCIERPSQH